jgi:hypothetical protein
MVPNNSLKDQVRERTIAGVDSGRTYPAEPTQLYYWRPEYRRARMRPARDIPER